MGLCHNGEQPCVQVAGAVIGAIAGTAAQAVFDSRMSHTLTVPDAVKVCYEMAVCAKAACDLARTPGIVIPTESIPPVSEYKVGSCLSDA